MTAAVKSRTDLQPADKPFVTDPHSRPASRGIQLPKQPGHQQPEQIPIGTSQPKRMRCPTHGAPGSHVGTLQKPWDVVAIQDPAAQLCAKENTRGYQLWYYAYGELPEDNVVRGKKDRDFSLAAVAFYVSKDHPTQRLECTFAETSAMTW